MKTICTATFILLFGAFLKAQELNPVKWEMTAIEEAHGLIAVSMTAVMDEGWHLYATYLPSDEGPFPTSIQIDPDDDYELVGELEYPDPITKYDENFMMDLNFYNEQVTFKRYVKPLQRGAIVVIGEVEYMCCNDEMCLPPRTVPIKIELKR